jgi:L-fuculose-phosphate aldolase
MTCPEAEAIIEVGHQLVKKGLVAGTWGNISARISGGDVFLITPSGVPYFDLQPGDLVAVDLEGKVREGCLRPSSETLLHAAIYQERPDVQGIVHTHSIYASVFAANHMDLPPVLEEMAQLLGGTVRVAPYASPGTEKLAASAVASLGESTAVILANHGVVGVGCSLAEALLICQVVEKGAQVFLLAKLLGMPYILPENEVKLLRKNFLENYGQK